jgi:hypothetical protein
MAIKVKAKSPGFYGHYREAGHEFEIKSEKEFSSRWMDKLEADPASKSKSKGKGKEEADAEEGVSKGDSDVI